MSHDTEAYDGEVTYLGEFSDSPAEKPRATFGQLFGAFVKYSILLLIAAGIGFAITYPLLMSTKP